MTGRAVRFHGLANRGAVRPVSAVAIAALIAGVGLATPVASVALPPEAPSVALAKAPVAAPAKALVAAPAKAPVAAPAKTPLAPTEVSLAQLSARARGKRVEVLSERSELAKTWANPDGSFTSESFSGPVRMRDAATESGWVDLDPTLVRQPDGSVVPKAHPEFLKLSGPVASPAGTTSLISQVDPGDPLTSSRGTRSQARTLSWGWPGRLPAPVLEGTKATYPDVRPNTDLVVEATTTGFEQFLVVKVRPTNPGDAAMTLPVATRGLRMAVDGRGGVSIKDAKGVARGRMPAPAMWDAQRVAGSDMPTNRKAVAMTLTQATAGQASVKLTPDSAFLMDPKTQYPVTIDPSSTLSASFDATVQTDSPTQDLSQTTYMGAGTYNEGVTTSRSFLTFPMPFKGAVVTAATMDLYNFYSSNSCTATRAVDVHVASPANAASRWANQPYINPTLYSRVIAAQGMPGCPAKYLTFDVKSLAQYWADNSTASAQSYAIQAASETDSYAWKVFNSSEDATGRPYMSVTYNSYPDTAGTPTHTPGTSSATANTGLTNTTTPTLKATVSDPDGGTVKALFSVYLNGTGTPVIDKMAGSTVTDGNVSSLVVPSGKLVNGSRYEVRAYADDGTLTSKAASGGYDNFTLDTSAGNPTPVTPKEAMNTNKRSSVQGCNTADPINCATGNFWHTFGDLSVPGRGAALNLQRTYNAFAHDSDSMFGYGWSNTYGMALTTDAEGAVTVAQENGSAITFAPNGSGGYTAPVRVLASLVKNADATFTLTDSRAGMTHTFAAAGRLLAQSDRNGVITTLGYDLAGQLTTVTDAAGRALTFAWANGRVTTATDPAGRIVSYSYDASGNLVTATDVKAGVWTFTYDSSHQMLTMTDPRGGVIATNTYDVAGRVTAQTDALGRTTTLAYSGDPASTVGSTTLVTDPRGNVATQVYEQLQMKSITHATGTPLAATTTYSYDAFTSNVASRTDPNGHTTSYTWDSKGNQTSSTDALGRTTTTSWTALNKPASVTDPAGHSTTFSYDPRGNPVAQHSAVSALTTQSTTFTYGDVAHPGDLTSVTDPTGKTWTMVYNANGDLTRRSNPLGDATSYTYDGTGRRTSMVSPRGNATGATPASFTTSYVYDPAGALTKSTNPLGHATSYGYDDNGNRTTVTDPLGHVTTSTFDAENQPTKATRADGTILSYGYDTGGNQTTQTDGKTNTTSYVYDARNQVSSSRDPLNRATTYGYDPAGQLTSKTNPAGQATTFASDAAGQRSSVSYSDGKTPNVAYTYTTLGQRASMADGSGTTAYTYDWLGRLTAQTNGAGQATSYTYDLAGHLTALTYPNGKVVTRGYDNAGRLLTVTDWLGHTNTLTPDPDGNPASVVSGNGVTAASTFDNAGQLSSTTDTGTAGTTIASFGYTRNANGQLASTTPTGVTQGNESYPYTQLNQLAGVNATTYTHDAADNLTKLTNGTTQSFDSANQLTGSTTAGATTSYTKDANGNRTGTAPAAGDKTNHSYDQAQRLTEVQKGKLYLPLTPARIADTRTGSGKPYAGLPLGPAGTLAVQVTGVGGVPTTGVAAVVLNVTEATATASTALTVFPTGVTRPGTSSVNAVAGGVASNQVTVPVGTNGQISIYNSAGTTNMIVDVMGYHSSNGAGMNAITPIRIADTATGSGKPYAGQSVPAGGTLTVQVSGTAGVPASATAAALQATVVTPTALGSLTAYPAGSLRPATSNLNYKVGVTATKEITAGLGTSPSGAVTFYNASTAAVRLIVDVAGYINVTGEALTPLTPARIADTRATSGQPNAGQTMAAGGSVTIQASGRGGIPANARSVVVNLTVPANTTNGYLTAYPGGTRPATTSLSHTPNDTVFNQVTVKLSATGTFTIWNSAGTADVIVDVMGSYGPVATYAYNGDGLRATRSTTAGVQKFAWDSTGGIPLLLTDGAVSYIYDDAGNPIEQIDAAGVVLYYQHDQYGSTRLLTNVTGAVAATFSYDPYGNLTGRTGSADTALRWNGQYQDTDTGLYYLRARYYDPATAQFLTRDPIEALSGSAYGYADNDPINTADPTGLISKGLCAGGAAGYFLGGFGQGCLVAAIDDRTGNISFGATATRTRGVGVQTPSASVQVSVAESTARNVDQLGGQSGYGGLSAGFPGIGPDIGAGVFAGKCADAPGGFVAGYEVSAGVGFGPGAEVHGGESYTWNHTLASITPRQLILGLAGKWGW